MILINTDNCSECLKVMSENILNGSFYTVDVMISDNCKSIDTIINEVGYETEFE